MSDGIRVRLKSGETGWAVDEGAEWKDGEWWLPVVLDNDPPTVFVSYVKPEDVRPLEGE